ncbi:MAG: hypothetical protein WAT66_09700 [Actinomycetota bacterium]
MKTLRAVRLVAGVRVAIGFALTFRTADVLRLTVRDVEPSGPIFVFAQTVGIRDLIFGLGALIESFEDPDRVDRWVWLWLANEVADVIAGALAAPHIGRRGAIGAAAAPLPFVAADVWALRARRISAQQA